jgi:hypothetical protein
MMNLSFDESLNSWIADILQNRVITWGVTKSLSLKIYPRYICTNPLEFNRFLSTLVHATSIDHIINSLHTKNVEWEMLKMSILLHFRKKIVLHVMYVLEKDEKNKSNRRNLLVSGKCARTRGEWTAPNQATSSHLPTWLQNDKNVHSKIALCMSVTLERAQALTHSLAGFRHVLRVTLVSVGWR